MATKKGDEEERRKRIRGDILLLLQRVRRVCGAVGKVDNIADLIDDVVGQVRDFVERPDVRDLLPERDRRRLHDAAERFGRAKDRIDAAADACKQLTKVLEAAEKIPAGVGFSMAVAATAAGALIAILVTVVVVVAAVGGDGGDDGDDGRGAIRISDPQDLHSTSHTIGQVSPNPVIIVEWSFHEGASAYAIAWTQSSTDVPGATRDLPGDATRAVSRGLQNGDWYFHLRTQGKNDQWTSTAHLGPFIIDTDVVGQQPPGAQPTNRMDCDAISGTAYLSQQERRWFLDNCVAPAPAPPTSVPPTSVPPTSVPPTATPYEPPGLYVSELFLNADPVEYVGACPVTITFSGRISVVGSGTVFYRFLRSDGASSPARALEFESSGSQDVMYTWTLGGPDLAYSGWVDMEIISPEPDAGVGVGAAFTVMCQPG
jgi:hypothetical protein